MDGVSKLLRLLDSLLCYVTLMDEEQEKPFGKQRIGLLSSERVITSCYEKLEDIFQDERIKNFEKEICLTPVLEYGRTKEEFYCNGFIFRTERSIEIIFTARRVISDDVGIDYGLRWRVFDTTEELDSLSNAISNPLIKAQINIEIYPFL